MLSEFAVGGPPSSPQVAVAAVEPVPAVSASAGPQPALLPATYVDPSSGVVVLQMAGPDGGVTMSPTPRQLDAYQSGAVAPPGAHPGHYIAEA